MSNQFVARKGFKSLGGFTLPLSGVSDTYVIQETDYFLECISGTFTVTLPTAIDIKGKQFVIKNTGNGTITVNTVSSQTIDGSLTVALTQNESIEVISDDANWNIIAGVGASILGTDLKSGIVTSNVFTGTPLTYDVVLSTSFINTNYSVVVTGGDARSWTIENKTSNGFRINSNSNTALTASVFWIANSNS